MKGEIEGQREEQSVWVSITSRVNPVAHDAATITRLSMVRVVKIRSVLLGEMQLLQPFQV